MNDSLYKEQLLDLSKNPANKGTLKDYSVEAKVNNPFCGDSLTLQLKLEKDVIRDVAFDGDACMVAIASSSLVTDKLRGKTLKEAQKISKKDIFEMLGTDLTTSRVRCATLILEALNLAYDKHENK